MKILHTLTQPRSLLTLTHTYEGNLSLPLLFAAAMNKMVIQFLQHAARLDWR